MDQETKEHKRNFSAEIKQHAAAIEVYNEYRETFVKSVLELNESIDKLALEKGNYQDRVVLTSKRKALIKMRNMTIAEIKSAREALQKVREEIKQQT